MLQVASGRLVLSLRRYVKVGTSEAWRKALDHELDRSILNMIPTFEHIEDSLLDKAHDSSSWAWWGVLPQDFVLAFGTQEVVARRPCPDPEWEPLAFRRLFVQDPEDVLELSPSELHIVWKHRNRLCGSAAAAAEVYAFLRLQQRIDEYYGGYQEFLALAEVQEAGSLLAQIEELEDFYEYEPDISSSELLQSVAGAHVVDDVSSHAEEFIPSQTASQGAAIWSTQIKPLSSTDAEEEKCSDDERVLYEDDIVYMSAENLQLAWERRKHVFADLRAASAALARLRFENRSDPILRSLDAYLGHELIQQLSGYLPEVARSATTSDGQKSDTELRIKRMTEDARTFAIRRQAIRQGQSGFRQKLIDFYGARCCISGSEVREVLEAAHILPYMGAHTNEVENGLLLRADIHQLFDAHLLSIHPETLTIEVCTRVTDGYYRSLIGRKISIDQPLNVAYLRVHHRMFISKHVQ
ncbi:MAG: HNH endonuclease [Polaromonas sp.]